MPAFAFDLDETLVDAEPQHIVATKRFLARFDVNPVDIKHVFVDKTGFRTRDYLAEVLAAARIDVDLDDALAERASYFWEACEATPLNVLPGAAAVVAAAKTSARTALVTSGYVGDVLATLEFSGLAERFDVVVTGEDVETAKPAPDPYLEAARRLDVPPADVVAFEDSRRGVAAALAAGCRVVAVPNARSSKPADVADAHIVLGSLMEALPFDAFVARLNAA